MKPIGIASILHALLFTLVILAAIVASIWIAAELLVALGDVLPPLAAEVYGIAAGWLTTLRYGSLLLTLIPSLSPEFLLMLKMIALIFAAGIAFFGLFCAIESFVLRRIHVS